MKKAIIVLSVVMVIFISMTATAIVQLNNKIDKQKEFIGKLIDAQMEINDMFAEELGFE